MVCGAIDAMAEADMVAKAAKSYADLDLKEVTMKEAKNECIRKDTTPKKRAGRSSASKFWLPKNMPQNSDHNAWTDG